MEVEDITTKRYSTIAVFSAIFAIVFSSAGIVFFDSWLLLLVGAPFSIILGIFAANHKLYYLTPIACAVVFYITFNDIFLSVAILLYLLISASLTGFLVTKGYEHKKIILTVSVFLCVLLVGMLMYSYYLQTSSLDFSNFSAFLSGKVDASFDELSNIIATSPGNESIETQNLLKIIPTYATTAKITLPAMLVSCGMLLAFIFFLFANTIHRKLNLTGSKFFENFKISATGGYIFGLLILLVFLGDTSFFDIVCLNIATCFIFCFFISGISFLYRLCIALKKRGASYGFLVAMSVMSFFTLAMLPFAIMGAIDSIFIKKPLFEIKK